MYVVPIGDWPTRQDVRAGKGRCFGIAIGPNSHEARVYVDGQLLQAGRVLPLRSSDGYSVSRATGVATSTNADGYPSAEQYLTSIKMLSLMVFECAEELACEVARPDHEFSTEQDTEADSPGTGEGDQGAEALPLVVPFVGRRQAQVRMHRTAVSGGAGKWGYRIVGLKWSASLKTLLATTLREVTGLDTDEEATMVGGVDEAEDYHQLAIYVTAEDGADAAATTQTFAVDVTTIGEIGVR